MPSGVLAELHGMAPPPFFRTSVLLRQPRFAQQAPGGGAETGPLLIGAVPRGSLGTSHLRVSGCAGPENAYVLLVQRHVSQEEKAVL